MSSLRCTQLSKKYGGIQALHEVTLGFREEITAVIGPNGAGKTTLINVLTGFVRPDRGTCYLGDVEITGLSPFRIARLGVTRTFQDQRLAYQLSALENVALAYSSQRNESLLATFIPFPSHERRVEVSALQTLELVGLRHDATRLAAELSHGQRKLLSLACAIAANPKVLILDEPVSGTDYSTRDRVIALLKRLSVEGRTIIFIEHDMATVRQLADRLILMDEGQVIAEGLPAEILQKKELIEAYLT